MPFLAYVDSRPRDPDEGRPPWEPNWRMWRWLAAAAVVSFGAGHADGAIQYLLILVVVAFACLGIEAALPPMRGLRDWRQ
jgi:hypothetical protein